MFHIPSQACCAVQSYGSPPGGGGNVCASSIPYLYDNSFSQVCQLRVFHIIRILPKDFGPRNLFTIPACDDRIKAERSGDFMDPHTWIKNRKAQEAVRERAEDANYTCAVVLKTPGRSVPGVRVLCKRCRRQSGLRKHLSVCHSKKGVGQP